ncbi:MAG: hypothetical protein IIA67_04895 [Planctomycetes bacterium]|nr:hypothetical protein [Planctomycetota bacterium]
MKAICVKAVSLACIVLIAGSANARERVWTDITGKHKVKAGFVGIEDGKVWLERKGGRRLSFPLEKLSRADQAIARIMDDQKRNNPKAAAGLGAGIRAFAVSAKDGRHKVPDPKDESAARQLVAELFADRRKKATEPQAKAALAEAYIKVGLETRSDVPAMFVLFQNALDLAVENHDLEIALKATDAVTKRFAVNREGVIAHGLARLDAVADSKDAHQKISEKALELIDKAVEDKQFEDGNSMFVVAIEAAQASGNAELLDAALSEFAGVTAMRRVLKKPDDPAANLALGRYYCFLKGNWKTGLPMLRKGSDARLSELAQRELAAPNEPEQQIALGDAWTSAAAAAGSIEKTKSLLRADHWHARAAASYRVAWSKASGIEKLKIKKKLTELTKRIKTRPAAVTGTDVITGSAVSGRTDPARKAALLKSGGNTASERAVDLALQWLANHQMADGGWNFDHRQGKCQGRCANHGSVSQARNAATAMALLPLLGAGHTHEKGSKYKDVVRGGLAYLGKHMKANGSLHESGGTMYSHGLATIALCEAYAMTQDKKLRLAAQKSVTFIEMTQDPVGGGWRYNPKQAGDTSVVGWQITALKAAHMAHLKTNPNTIKGAEKFLNSVSTQNGAYYGYTNPGRGNATTAIGLLCRMYLGWKHDNPALQRGVRFLSESGPSKNLYYTYYASQVMRHYDGPKWKKWNDQMRPMLVKSQDHEGHQAGSWFFGGASDHGASRGGRLYTTAMAAMILEVYYRHLPIYQKAASLKAKP